MKKIYIIIILLVLVVGIFLFISKGKKAEAPIVTDNSSPVSSTMPVPGFQGVKEMVVEEVIE